VGELAVVTVVGAGPVGLRCAALIAREGFEVNVLEEHSTVGQPLQCTGLVSVAGLHGLKLGLAEEDFVVNRVFGARIFSPGGEEIRIVQKKAVALVIDRPKFDRLLYKQALKENVSVNLGSKLIDLRGNSLFIETRGHGELQKSIIVVGADGPNSIVRHAMHPNIGEESFMHALQYRAEGSFDEKTVELYFGKYAKGFFAWVVPESSGIARIGLGTRLGHDVEKCMRIFLNEKKLEAKAISKSSGLIPVMPPLRKVCENNALLVGDAASHVKATTGGGLVLGLEAAKIAAESIANNLKHGALLREYEKNLSGINKELSIHWKMHSFLHSLSENQLDGLFTKAKKSGIEDFLEQYGDMDKPSRFVKKILLKPRLWGLAPTAMRFILR
jgi:geranylgeranyl reductase family protein